MQFRFFIFALSLFCLMVLFKNANSQHKRFNEREIKWNKVSKVVFSDQQEYHSVDFAGAIYEVKYGKNPLFLEQIPLRDSRQSVSAQIINPVYRDLSPQDLKALDIKFIESSPVVDVNIYYDRGIPIANLTVLPFRKNPNNGSVEKLVSFNLELQFDEIPRPKESIKRDYRTSSVLTSGNWYKFSINRSGIYKIGYSDLVAMGINPSQIDPRNIRIYGNGGKMLPESNAAFRYDDLKENAIQVVGEANGQFNQNDYILFYAQGTASWAPDYSAKQFRHTLNKYSDYAFYFLTTDIGPGKRIVSENSLPLSPTNSINDFNDYAFHENDSLNLIKSGREWFGEVFDIITSHSFNFTFPNRNISSRVYVSTSLAARSRGVSSAFTVNASGNVRTIGIQAIAASYNTDFAIMSNDTMSFLSGSPGVNINLSYNKPGFSSVGWLNYIAINVRRNMIFSGSQMSFRDLESIGPGNISEFRMQNASSSLQIWDVTDFTEPRIINGSVSGSELSFIIRTDSLREFVAHNGQSYYNVRFVGRVENQNLHATPWQDMVIVSHPLFIQQANRLADFHRTHSGLRVAVVQPEHIYNEFASGIADISAIRDFMKMFYDRADGQADQKPKYLLLFGKSSYDPKGRIPNNTNFVPTFQSIESLHPAYSYLTDDYFGLLDDHEGTGSSGNLDLGIGRMPVVNSTQARQVVDKIFRYAGLMNKDDAGKGSTLTGQTHPYGDWRNVICLVADDEDSNLHLYQAEELARYIDDNLPVFNVDKVYFDAYPQISTPGGQRYPDVNRAINDRVQKGALIVNYTGHGGETGWAHERVLEISDINSWTNTYNMPVFITATCEFSRFDDPDPARVSAGELVFLNPDGGAIAMYTTTRLAFSNTNFAINYALYQHAFSRVDGEFLTMGEIMRRAKVSSGSSSFNRNFVLFGDPALKMAYPKHNINTISINGIGVEPITMNDSIPGFESKRIGNINAEPDTFKALSKVTISGSIINEDDKVLSGFKGFIYPTVYDKKSVNTTLGNDPLSFPRNFHTQKSILYRGKASVEDGRFRFSFIVPRDIAYRYDFGKISYYAYRDGEDASGVFNRFVVGGINLDATPDTEGPEIQLFLNDEQFAFGGLTDENPILIAKLSDSSGINTVGSGIGHDIVAVLNENTNQSIVLNDYYQADLDSYKSGSVRYPLSKLEEGPHRLRLKAWDVYNNSSEAYTEFVVSHSSEMALMHVLNYPNPFTTKTSFMFEHNQACCELDVVIEVFTISGRLVKTLNEKINIHGFLVGPGRITWDGRDDFGDKIGRGVYIYRLKISDETGNSTEKFEKLVILN